MLENTGLYGLDLFERFRSSGSAYGLRLLKFCGLSGEAEGNCKLVTMQFSEPFVCIIFTGADITSAFFTVSYF
jgi:hypothetical protein